MQASRQGKVRDVYEINDKQIVLVASDRISAFDVILPKTIKNKGKILTQMSLFWFDFTKNICKNHIISSNTKDIPEFFQSEVFDGRTLLVKKLKIVPFECIVRGYAFGSYQDERYQLAEKLPAPIFTPSTKAEHDENVSKEFMANQIGTELTNQIERISLDLYKTCYAHALSKGLIIADAKFEFGLDENNELYLADEIFTPDSSRYWCVGDYKIGTSPKSYDKQLLRDWLLNNNMNFDEVPDEILDRTYEIYQKCLNKITV